MTSRAIARRRLSHEVAADVAQRGLALAVLAGGHHLPDAHVRAEREQHQQQAPAQDLSWNPLLVRHRDELLGQAGHVVGVLEHVGQVDGSPATHDLRLERPQPARLVELVQPWHVKPGLAAALTEVDAAGPPSPDRAGVRLTPWKIGGRDLRHQGAGRCNGTLADWGLASRQRPWPERTQKPLPDRHGTWCGRACSIPPLVADWRRGPEMALGGNWSAHSARRYSWMSPPRRSRRSMGPTVSWTSSAGGHGRRCSMPW